MIWHNKRLVIVSVLLLISVAYCKLPDYIKVCQRNVPNINECIMKSIEHLEPYLKVGIPEINVPSLEPFHLNEPIIMHIGNGGDTVVLTNLTDLVAYGASAFKLNNLWSDLDKNSFRFNVTVPALVLKGFYEIDTKLLFLHIAGNGNITINVDNYNFECTLKGEKIKKGSDEYLKFEKMQCDIKFDKASIHLANLFAGNELLGNTVNAVINDNIDIFFHEIKPKLIDAISEIFTDVANRITLHFTYAELFP